MYWTSHNAMRAPWRVLWRPEKRVELMFGFVVILRHRDRRALNY